MALVLHLTDRGSKPLIDIADRSGLPSPNTPTGRRSVAKGLLRDWSAVGP